MKNKINKDTLYQLANELGFKVENFQNIIFLYKDDVFVKQVTSFKKGYLYLYNARNILKKGGTPAYQRILERENKRKKEQV